MLEVRCSVVWLMSGAEMPPMRADPLISPDRVEFINTTLGDQGSKVSGHTVTQTLTHDVTWDTPTNKSFRLRPLKPRCGCSVRFPIRCAPGCREPASLILSSDMVDNVVKLAQPKLSQPLFLFSHKDTGASPCSISPWSALTGKGHVLSKVYKLKIEEESCVNNFTFLFLSRMVMGWKMDYWTDTLEHLNECKKNILRTLWKYV